MKLLVKIAMVVLAMTTLLIVLVTMFNDNVIMLTERADKTENRDPNVFNFVYLFIILGK